MIQSFNNDLVAIGGKKETGEFFFYFAKYMSKNSFKEKTIIFQLTS